MAITTRYEIQDAVDRSRAARPPNRMPLIHQHLRAMQEVERRQWDEARRWLQGRFWTDVTGGSEWNALRTSSNLVFAIAETAVASLVPRHPQITIDPRVPMEPDDVLARERYVNMVLDATRFRREQQMSIQDCVLCGRSIYKTTWSAKHGRPVVRAIDPRSLIFDLTARRTEDIRYFCEVTVLSEQQFRERVADGTYTLPKGKQVPAGDAYPKWLVDSAGLGGGTPSSAPASSGSYRDIRNWQPWITVYEWYDVHTGMTSHWHEGFDTPLYEGETDYVPYTLYFLNSNGEDCRGLSEVLLVKPNIEAVNKILTYMLELVRLQVPKILVDAGLLDGEEVVKINKADPASLVSVMLQTPGASKALAEAFARTPIAEIPAEIGAMLAKQESVVSYVSALAEAARGQVTGARTATELALIEGQLRTRLQARQMNVDEATADIGRKVLYLANKKLQAPLTVRTGVDPTGRPTWTTIQPTQLSDSDVYVNVVPYTPLDSNRAVIEERFLTNLGIVVNRPGANQALINEELARVLRVDPRMFDDPQPPIGPADGMIPDADVAGATPAQLAAVAAATRGSSAEESQLPPQLAAVSDAVVESRRGPDAG